MNEPIVFKKIYPQYLQAGLETAVGYKAGLRSAVAQHDFATQQFVLRVEEKILTCLNMALCFKEITDLLYALDVSLDVKQLEAVYAGARYGMPG